jgi:phosphonatase-like hydrolase
MGIKLVVCDMAGTTVEENGLVYRVLRESMVKHGLTVSEEDMHPWHGAAKGEVIRNFIERQDVEGLTPAMIDRSFEETIKHAYAQEGAVAHISSNLSAWVDELHAAQIQIGLNTGYPQDIQMRLIDGLGLDRIVDHWISAYQVAAGRPAPYMVHRLMEASGVHDVARVAKVGDTVNDIEEGRNAGCGLVVGVLSGADDAEALHRAGADVVIPDITHLHI